MSRLVCLRCGFKGEAEDFYDEEIVGYIGDSPARLGISTCPNCHSGDVEEVAVCDLCGEEYAECGLMSGVCNDCFKEARYNPLLCRRVSENETESIKLNQFLATVFTVGEIEDILTNIIKERMPQYDCMEFISQDVDWFAERLKEVKSDENTKS